MEKDLKKLTDEYIVLISENRTDDTKYVISKRENFSSMPLCETYDKYGIKVGEYECGCEDDEDSDHYEVDAYNYWDGSNWKTVSINGNFPDFYEALSEISTKVLSEMPDTPYIDGTHEIIETENYSYTFTRYASDWAICSVE